MKQKYLLGMLLGGAMLAACSTEDDFNQTPVAQKNVTAPVFTVSLDGSNDPLTRAQWSESGWKIGFENNDKLSLFHGVTETNLTTFKGWQNAVYKGEGEAETPFKFTTQALVVPGYAVMVYPADTEFSNTLDESQLGESAPLIKIDQDQTEKTKLNTPYMSEILDVKLPGEDVVAEAGYDKEYDIVLRRVAGILTLTMNTTGAKTVEGVDLKIKKVELKDENELFTISVPVKGTDARPEDKEHPSWAKKSDLDFSQAKGVTSITTADVNTESAEKSVATFTLLPAKTDIKASNSEFIVHTSYGKVTVAEDDNTAWVGSVKRTTAEVLDVILPRTYEPATSGLFNGENIGQHINATINVDMSNMDMDKIHIANGNELQDALKVYNGLGLTEEVTWILDGETEGDYKEKFVMDDATWDAVKTQLEKEGNKIKLAACGKDNEKCTAIVLQHEGNAVEIPGLKFETEVDGETDITNGVDVELEGNWKFTEVTEDPTIEDNESEGKVLEGINKLIVTADGKLGISGYIATTATVEIEVKFGGNVEVSGLATLQVNMTNFGDITIPLTTSLYVDKNATLENRESQDKDADGWNENCGKIFHSGTLAIINETNGKINNYGLIKLEDKSASTLISSNGDAASLKTAFGSSNRFGTIYLKEKKASDEYTIIKGDNKGFIKLDYSGDLSDDTGIANYIVYSGSKITKKADKVLYLELANATGAVSCELGTEAAPVTLTGLMIRNDAQLRIPSGKGLKVSDAIYMGESKGSVLFGGTFTYTSVEFEGYFAGDKNAAKRIASYGE